MYNKKVLKKITSSLDKAKKPAVPKDIIVDPKGQWNHPGEVTRIPASNITMEGVNYPVMGVPNIGMPVMMYPGQDYDFPGANYVDEYPQMKTGGALLTKKVTCKDCGWKWDAADGGSDITTCHKCGGQGLVHAQDGGDTDAMNGMMKARLAYANEFGNPAAQRMINLPDNPYQFDNGDTGTHYMASMDNYAVPQIQDEDGQLMLGDYGPESDEAMRFESDEDADYFAKHYKDVSPGFMEMELSPEEIQEYAKGGFIIEDVSVPELTKAQKGKVVQPLEISDPKEFKYRNKMYNDSLVAYNRDINFDRDYINLVKKAKSFNEIYEGKQKLQNKYPLNKVKPSITRSLNSSPTIAINPIVNYKAKNVIDFKKPTQPVVFKKAPENQIVPTVEQMVTPAKVVQPIQKKVVAPVVQPKPVMPDKGTAYRTQTVMYPDGTYELRQVPYWKSGEYNAQTGSKHLNPPGVVNAVDLTPEEVNLLKKKDKLNSKKEGGALLKAQDGKTVKYTDKKGNTTTTVTDDDGTQYIKVKTADGKVYNKTVPAMEPMPYTESEEYRQGIDFPVANQKSETLQNSVNQKATLPQEIENKKDMLGDLQREREAFAVRQSKDQISKGKAPRAPQDWKDKVTDIAFNPMTAAGHWMRGQEVPDYLQESLDNGTYGYWANGKWHTERNPLDIVSDITPIGAVHSAKNIVDKATDDVDGNFWTYNTLLDAANIIPTASLVKGLKGLKSRPLPPLAPPNIARINLNPNRALDLGSDIMQPFKPKNIGVDVLDNTTRNLEPIVNTEGKIIRQLGDPKYTEEGLKRFIGNTGVTAKTAAQLDELDLSDLFDDFDESEMARIFGERPLNQSNIPAYQRRTIIDFSNPDVMNNLTRENLLSNSSNEMAPDPDFLRRTTYNPTVVHETFDWGALDDKANKTNRSGLSKDEILAKASKKDKDILSKMSEDEFIETVLKPTGDIAKYKPSLTVDELMYDTDLGRMRLKNQKPISAVEYAEEFNKNLDELNKIIAKNNKSGVEYKVKKLDPSGNLIFETPEQTIRKWEEIPEAVETIKDFEKIKNDPVQLKNSVYTKNEIDEIINAFKKGEVIPAGESRWGVNINPGKWKGKVEDIPNEEYFKNIPGINMSNTTNGVFSDRVTRRGTGTYESINEYLKKFDLGRVKPGFNSQTKTSKGLWENAVQKDKAYGYYGKPNTVYGSMKSMLPYLVPTAIGAGAAAMERDKFKKGGNVNDEMELDLTPEQIKEYISKGYVIEQVH